MGGGESEFEAATPFQAPDRCHIGRVCEQFHSSNHAILENGKLDRYLALFPEGASVILGFCLPVKRTSSSRCK